MTAPSVFSSKQFDTALYHGVEQDYWYRARHHLLGRTMGRHLAPGAAVLDVGCGPGFTVDYLRQLGYQSFGVELGEPEIVRGARDYVSVNTAVLDTPESIADSISCLLYLDVIEHVPDPVLLLR